MTKKLLTAVAPTKPVNEMTDEELEALVDQIYEAATKSLGHGTA